MRKELTPTAADINTEHQAAQAKAGEAIEQWMRAAVGPEPPMPEEDADSLRDWLAAQIEVSMGAQS